MELDRNSESIQQQGFADRVAVHRHDGGSCYVMPVSTPDIVSFEGSFVNVPAFAAGDGLLRDLTVSMLDKGTKKHSKLEIAELLEGLGAELNVHGDGVRVRVSGRALKKDLPEVLRMLSEVLQQPSFPADEFELLKARYEASYRRRMTNTSSVASSALSRRIFGVGHPNYIPETSAQLDQLAGTGVEHAMEYFQRHVRIADWRLAIVGDVEWDAISGVIRDEFSGSLMFDTTDMPPWGVAACEPAREDAHIEDRENIDVKIGHLVDITNTDPSYVPLFLGVYVLGGNFSARLMKIVRDQMGLTYGIHSSLSEMDALHSGMWYTSVTLSRPDLEKGIQETLRLLEQFAEKGITREELEEKKTTIAGSFKVALSSTAAIASGLLRNAEKMREPAYLDHYPGLIAGLSLEEVNREISGRLDAARLHVSVAGTIPHRAE